MLIHNIVMSATALLIGVVATLSFTEYRVKEADKATDIWVKLSSEQDALLQRASKHIANLEHRIDQLTLDRNRLVYIVKELEEKDYDRRRA